MAQSDRDKKVEQFIQKSGPRSGQSYRVKKGASGKSIRVYASGDTALVKPPKGPSRRWGLERPY